MNCIKNILPLVILVLPLTRIIAQNSVVRTTKKMKHYQKVYKWEAYTQKGVIIFGVSKSKEAAQAVINDFSKRNWNTSARPIAHYIDEAIATTPDYFQQFASYFPKGYYLLSTTDVAALQIIEKAGISTAATYLSQCNEKKYKQALEYLSVLHHNYAPYRIKIHKGLAEL